MYWMMPMLIDNYFLGHMQEQDWKQTNITNGQGDAVNLTQDGTAGSPESDSTSKVGWA